jgi:hypothetical protein
MRNISHLWTRKKEGNLEWIWWLSLHGVTLAPRGTGVSLYVLAPLQFGHTSILLRR